MVEDSTGKVIWNDQLLNSEVEPAEEIAMNGWIKNRGSTTDWVTAYVAPDPWQYTDETSLPKRLEDIHGIIANSKGMLDTPIGIQSAEETAGGSSKSEAYCGPCHGDPITTSTGEYYEIQSDINTVGEGLTPNVERTFSTLNKDVVRSLSSGWRTNYEMRIISGNNSNNSDNDSNLLTANKIKIENENGSITNFYKNVDGKYQTKSDTLATLEYDSPANTFKYERHVKSREIFIFDSSGKLIEIRNKIGQKVILSYDNNNKLSTASDNVGNYLNFLYNEDGNLSAIVSQTGETATYTYNNEKQLTNVKNHKNVDFTYTYDNAKRVTTFTNQLGGIFTNTYDNSDRIIEQVDPLGQTITFAYSGNLQTGSTIITYPNGKTVIETYERGRIVKKSEGSEDSEHLVWNYSYDSTGNLSSETNPGGTSTSSRFDSRGNKIESIDSNNNSTFFIYDSNDNLVKIKDRLGNETVNVYDENKNLILTTSPLGEKTSFTYTTDNQLASVTDARGNESGANPADFTSTLNYLPNRLLSASKDSLGNETNSIYNNRGQLSSKTNSLGFASEILYNSLGLPEKIIDPLNNETFLTYDKMENVLTSVNAMGAITTYTYDLMGNMLTSKTSMNEVTTYVYDNMSKPVRIELPDGSVQKISYDVFSRPIKTEDALGRFTAQEWDDNSNLKASIDADGGRTEYFYNDRNGNLTGAKNPTGGVEKYYYDKMDRRIATIDPLGRVTQVKYDANGREVSTLSADCSVTSKDYDSVGNIIKTTDESGKNKTYIYDSLNRKISYTNEIGQTIGYSYDSEGNLKIQTRPDGTTVTHTYDARDLLIKSDYPGDSEDVIYVYDSLGRTISERKGSQDPKNYSYDALNRITSQGESGQEVSYNYDSVGNILKMTYPSGRIVDYEYNSVKNTTKVNSFGITNLVLGYNNRGLETSAILPNGVTENSLYDASSRLLSTELLKGSESLYKRTQVWNDGNEVTQKGVYIGETSISLENFHYDPLSRLTTQQNDDTSDIVNSYDYSIVGNLHQIGSSSQTHDDAGKLTNTSDSAFSYDDRNNRTATVNSSDPTKNVEYSWTQNNTLSEITTRKDGIASPETITSYEYDTDNLLKSRSQNGATDEFVWDTNREIPVMLSDGKFEYIYKTTSDRVPFAQIDVQTQEILYLHHDLTGSIVGSTSMIGKLNGKVDYSPYGVPSGNLVSRFGYAGEWTDETTKYTYLRNRWLDTSTGSFLSEDPLVQVTANSFRYTEGNPIVQIDPFGLKTDPYDVMLDHSPWISLGLAIVGTVTKGKTTIVLTAADIALNGASANRNWKEGKMTGVAWDIIGMGPGAGVIKGSKTILKSGRVVAIAEESGYMGRKAVIAQERVALAQSRIDRSGVTGERITGINLGIWIHDDLNNLNKNITKLDSVKKMNGDRLSTNDDQASTC